jgi:hypothetical protein
MPIDLWWHWQLVGLGWRKKCPHKDHWQVLQHKDKEFKHILCAGCLRARKEPV